MKMKPVTIEKVAEVTGGTVIGPRSCRNDRISGVATDSRNVHTGDLFFCIKGARVDGHDFANAAYEQGAACCVAEKKLNTDEPYVLVESTLQALKDLAEWYRGLFDIPVVGIVGSVGKTTAKELTAAVLGRKFCVLKTPANLNNEIGVPLTLMSLCEEHEAAVVEMGISDFGEMRRLAKMVRPDILVMTTIGYCHLETLGDLAGVLRAKSEVFEYMERDAVAVLNGDDEILRTFEPGTRRLTFGLDVMNDVWAENVENLGFEGISCDICHENIRVNATIPAFGTHIVYGALAAAAVGRVLGVSEDDIVRGLADYHPVGGRANVMDTGRITIINDCYNANPNSMAASIRSLSSIRALSGEHGKRIAVLGDMKELGIDSAELHAAMGRLAAEKKIDLVFCCGQEAKYICDGCVNAGGSAYWFSTKDEMYPALDAAVEPGDVVLVKASHSMGFEDVVIHLGGKAE